jgi:uncharacterized protein YunC (DUF1805 family)
MPTKRKRLTPRDMRIIKWMPQGWSLKIDPRQVHRGEADPTTKRITLQSLGGAAAMEWMVFLHEVGHVVCGHFNVDTVEHVKEFEADQFAIMAAKLEGIMVPELWTVDSKSLLKEALRNDILEGVTPERYVLNWVS